MPILCVHTKAHEHSSSKLLWAPSNIIIFSVSLPNVIPHVVKMHHYMLTDRKTLKR